MERKDLFDFFLENQDLVGPEYSEEMEEEDLQEVGVLFAAPTIDDLSSFKRWEMDRVKF